MSAPSTPWCSRRRPGTVSSSRVVRNTDRLLDVLDAHGVKSHVLRPRLGCRAISRPGAAHRRRRARTGVARLRAPLDLRAAPARFRDDLRRAKQLLEDQSGIAVRGYRAPSFSVVRAPCGRSTCCSRKAIAYDASIFPIHHDRYGIPDAPRHPHVLSAPPAAPHRGAAIHGPRGRQRTCRSPAAATSGCCRYAWTRWGIRRAERGRTASPPSSTCTRGKSIPASRASP